jgi:hypothetical protein
MNVTASAEGSLFELVSRGNKDTLFFKDSSDSKCIFDNSYEAQSASTTELRRVVPKSTASFGRTVEFDIDVVGDIMTNPVLVVKLPTWLPPHILTKASSSVITDLDGVSYGYTNSIGFFLFEQIQFYQDNILLQEFSGDALWCQSLTQGTYGKGFITHELSGKHDGSSISIARNAALNKELRIKIPLIGCQPGDSGFPQRVLQSHTFRLRCKIRKLEDLVEASDGRAKPIPWGRSDFLIKLSSTASPTPFTTLDKTAMAPLEVFLESTQIYTTKENIEELQRKPHTIPFKRIYENIFTQNQLDYAGVVGGSTSIINRRLDACHPSGRLLWIFRSQEYIRANKLWNVTNSLIPSQVALAAGVVQGSYYNSVSLVIAGQTRETARNSTVWKDIVNFAKEDLDTGTHINTMNWGLGTLPLKRYETHTNPDGSINFSTADRPNLYIDLALAPNDPLTGAPSTELRVFVEGWAVYKTDGKGRGELFSAN